MSSKPDILGPTAVSGGYNVIWSDEGEFILLGHLSRRERIVTLRDTLNEFLLVTREDEEPNITNEPRDLDDARNIISGLEMRLAEVEVDLEVMTQRKGK